MEATRYRNIKSGVQYDSLFGKAPGNDHTIKRSADLKDTMQFIAKVVRETLDHTVKLSHRLKGSSVPETCSNIWHFVYNHIRYKKDEKGYEQVRSPRRAWHDRRTGVDCDCYSVFISSVLSNLKIPHILRITKYKQDHFQHIYPIVPYGSRYITLDCVTDAYDFEVPFSAKKDYSMELQYLDGLDDYGGDITGLSGPKKKKKGFFKRLNLKKVLNVVNKINPATVLLRNGLLAAMKLNVMNVAKRLRWSYLTAEQAAAKNVEAGRYQKLLATRQKIEKIFYGAGGKTDNLRKAILKGKGNKDKAVQGLDGLGDFDVAGLAYIDVSTPLTELLGPEVYYSENMDGLNGIDALDSLGELGEPVSMAAIGAAMGVIKTIASSLKQIGNIFKGKGEGSADFDEATNEAAENNQPVKDTTPLPPITTQPVIAPLPDDSNLNPGAGMPAPNQSASLPAESLPAEMQEENISSAAAASSLQKIIAPGSPAAPPDPEKDGFWAKNKKWLKPVGFVAGGLVLVTIGYKLLHKKKGDHSISGLSGAPRRKSRCHKKKQAVALI